MRITELPLNLNFCPSWSHSKFSEMTIQIFHESKETENSHCRI